MVREVRRDEVAGPFQLIMRVPVPWVFVLMYLIGAGLEHLWPVRLGGEMSGRVTSAVGGVLFTIGALIAGWGLVTFHRARTTTVPGESSSRLVTWGPYRFSRNPMYVGLTIAYLGEAFLLRQVWPAVLLPVVLAYVNWVVIPVEQARLTDVFDAEYVAIPATGSTLAVGDSRSARNSKADVTSRLPKAESASSGSRGRRWRPDRSWSRCSCCRPASRVCRFRRSA